MRLLVALLLLAASVEARPRPRPRSRAPRGVAPPTSGPAASGASAPRGEQGHVTAITSDAAFLDRGAADGVTVGQAVAVTRAGRAVGVCTVEAVAQRSARCAAASSLKVGDVVAVARGPQARPAAPTPLPSEAELSRRGAQLRDEAWALREFGGGRPTLASRAHLDVALGHTTYASGATLRGPFHQQRLDAAFEVDVYRGLRVAADVTVLHFAARPDGHRSPYPAVPVLLVHQLAVAFRRADVAFSGAVGRTWLRGAPGLLVLDGAQAAYRLAPELEVGAFGGLLPQAAQLTVQPSQFAAGAFAAWRRGAPGGALVELSGRAGYALRDGLGARFEAGLAASVWARASFDAHASAELGYGAVQAPGGVEAARLDVGWRPTPALRVLAAGRYRGLPVAGVTEVGLLSPGLRAVHGDGSVVVTLPSRLTLGVTGGVASDLTWNLLQARVGPELGLPPAWGGRLQVSLGWVEELGWVRGRHLYVQAGLFGGSVVRLVTRTSFFHQQGGVGSEGLASAELGTSVALELSPWRWLRARVVLVGRAPLEGGGGPQGSLGAQLGGGF